MARDRKSQSKKQRMKKLKTKKIQTKKPRVKRAAKKNQSGNVSVKDSQVNARDIVGHDKIEHAEIFQAGSTKIVQEVKPSSPKELREAYLSWVIKEARALPLIGSDPQNVLEETRRELDLASVYTALMTQRLKDTEFVRSLTADGTKATKISRSSTAGKQDDGLEREERLSALEALNADKYLALLGDPGSGKSTFVNFVAICMAGELLGDHPQANLETLCRPLPSEEDENKKIQDWDHGALLPVRVILRDFASQGLTDSLWNFIVAQLPEPLRDFEKDLRDELLQRGGLLLLDGLDEVPEAEQRREQVKQLVQDFVALFPKLRALVTSRVYAYQQQKWKLDDFGETTLVPFAEPQIIQFVDRWYAYIAPSRGMKDDDAKGRAAQLKDSIKNNPRIRELAERPLLLTLMASLHAYQNTPLPERRHELYEESVKLLLDQWELKRLRRKADGEYEMLQPSIAEYLKVDKAAIRGLLERLAFEAHRDQEKLEGTADIAQKKLLEGLLEMAASKDVRPKQLEEYLSFRAGVLYPRGVGVYTFPHRSFQEYLAACHLTSSAAIFPYDLAELTRAALDRWREVTLLAGAKNVSSVWGLVDALCLHQTSEVFQTSEVLTEANGAFVSALTLIETESLKHERVLKFHESKINRIRGWLVYILENGLLKPTDRDLAGKALSQIGDPRDLEELVTIRKGKFIMGSKEEGTWLDERPQHDVTIAYDYKIGKYPVTVKLWKRFVSQTKHPCRPESIEGYDNHPVTYVNWHDARAFCKWLTDVWRNEGKITQREIVRLPSEAEWECAARGTDGLEWSWGNEFKEDHANTNESGIGHTTAVGSFPKGKSPEGCLDMCGNVWEWTLSLTEKYPYKADGSREQIKGEKDDRMRVLRGGAFDFVSRLVRVCVRDVNPPRYVWSGSGFRVCAAPV